MRIDSPPPARGTSAGLLIVALVACTDASRISAPHREPPIVSASPAKQGPTNSRILYLRGDPVSGGPTDIYSMDDDGGNVVQLTFTDAIELDAAWAPDGRRVMYTSDADGRRAIYVRNPDELGATRITYPTDVQTDRHPQALGKRIVFTRFDAADNYPSLWVMNDDGRELTRLTRGAEAHSPAPSPGGKRVAFIRSNDVWVVDVETGAVNNLTMTAEGFELMPAWSPSGKQIAFAREVVGGNQDIFVMNADGTEVAPLTDTPGYLEFAPRWAPDSKRIAFAANYAGSFGVWSMFADATGLSNLSQSHTPYVDELPGAWAR